LTAQLAASRRDIVTGGRGLAALFPGAQDFEVSAPAHGAEKYLGEPGIAGLVAELLYPSKDLVPATADIVVRMTGPEASMLLIHHFAEAVADEIKDKDRATRYRSVMQLMRDDLAAQLQQRANVGQPLSFEMQQLADGQLPDLPHRWELHEAVGELVVLALTNCVAPYEIDVGDAPMRALDDGAALMGFQRSHGTKVATAIKEVQAAVSGKGGVPWGRVLTAAAGLALVAAGPIGLAVAAPAGVFGGAAIAGGLAAFGPGGMVGGLAMLGGLAGTGAAVAAAAVADWRPDTAADQKIKKDGSGATPQLAFVENPDILATVAQSPAAQSGALFCVGFAAESHDLLAHATAKRQRKQVPLLVGNIGPSTFGQDDNALLLVDAQGAREVPRASKHDLAHELITDIARRIQG
jgi:hypothetical protein